MSITALCTHGNIAHGSDLYFHSYCPVGSGSFAHIDIIFTAIALLAACVVVHKRYARKTPSTKVNGHKEFIFDCTVLGKGAVPLEMPTATETGGTITKPMIHSLFKDDAICQYAYKGKKHIVSQLISIAGNTTSLNTTYDSSDDDDPTPLSALALPHNNETN